MLLYKGPVGGPWLARFVAFFWWWCCWWWYVPLDIKGVAYTYTYIYILGGLHQVLCLASAVIRMYFGLAAPLEPFDMVGCCQHCNLLQTRLASSFINRWLAWCSTPHRVQKHILKRMQDHQQGHPRLCCIIGNVC